MPGIVSDWPIGKEAARLEHDLIVRLQQEYSDELFEQLYRLYADRAIRTAAAITGSAASAADVVQETFIRVYRNLGSYDLDRPFEPWFYRILYNECNRYLKKQARMVPSEISEEKDLPSETDTYEFDRHGEVYEMVQQLDDKHRIPVILKYLNDLAEKDIAELMDLNVNTVKSRLFQARKKLKEWVLNRGGEFHGS